MRDPILAADFSHRCWGAARPNFRHRSAIAIEADALHLPWLDNSVDLITTAFGFRNLANYEAGLPSSIAFSAPAANSASSTSANPAASLGKLYAFYFRRILPAIGSRLSGIAGPYAYLPASVHNFPPPAQMLEIMAAAGFGDVSWTPYSFGMAGLYRAVK